MPEARDAEPRVFRRLAVVLAVAALAAAGLATAQFALLHPGRPPELAGDPPPGPRLQDAPRSEAEELRRRHERLLGSYGRSAPGFARVPIERAMELLLEDGLPVQEARP